MPVQISEIFGLVNANGIPLNFYLMHLRIAMNIIKMGVQISEGPLYYGESVILTRTI